MSMLAFYLIEKIGAYLDAESCYLWYKAFGYRNIYTRIFSMLSCQEQLQVLKKAIQLRDICFCRNIFKPKPTSFRHYLEILDICVFKDVLNYACNTGWLSFVMLLESEHVPFSADNELLSSACIGGNLELLRYLLKEVKFKTPHLVQLIMYNHYQPVKLVLEVQPELATEKALSIAFAYDRLEVCKLLESVGVRKVRTKTLNTICSLGHATKETLDYFFQNSYYKYCDITWVLATAINNQNYQIAEYLLDIQEKQLYDINFVYFDSFDLALSKSQFDLAIRMINLNGALKASQTRLSQQVSNTFFFIQRYLYLERSIDFKRFFLKITSCSEDSCIEALEKVKVILSFFESNKIFLKGDYPWLVEKVGFAVASKLDAEILNRISLADIYSEKTIQDCHLVIQGIESRKTASEHVISYHQAIFDEACKLNDFQTAKFIRSKYHVVINEDNVQNVCYNGDYDFAVFVLQHAITVPDNLLDYLCFRGKLNILKYVIDILPDKTRGFGLNYASENGHLEIVKFIIEKARIENRSIRVFDSTMENIRPSIFDISSHAFDWACANGHFEIVEALTQIKAPYTQNSLIWAINEGNYEIVVFLVKVIKIEVHENALLEAAMIGHVKIMIKLLEKYNGMIPKLSASDSKYGNHSRTLALLIPKAEIFECNMNNDMMKEYFKTL